MKFINKTEGKIKVEKEGINPKEWKTLYAGDTIECESSIFELAYKQSGLVKDIPEEVVDKKKTIVQIAKPNVSIVNEETGKIVSSKKSKKKK